MMLHRIRRGLSLALISLAFVACAPVSQPFHEASQPVLVSTQFIQSADGAQLPMKRWMPSGPEKPRAIIVALHGFNDYSNAFAAAGEFMAPQGVGIVAFDQRGFGGSPQRGIWGGIDNLTRDAELVVRATIAAYPDVPVYLLGESMGGIL